MEHIKFKHCFPISLIPAISCSPATVVHKLICSIHISVQRTFICVA